MQGLCMLAPSADKRRRFPDDLVAGQEAQPLGGLLDAAGYEKKQAIRQVIDLPGQLLRRRHEAHRGLGGRGGPEIGDELDDGGVGFVADGGDEGNGAGEGRVCDLSLIERPKILERPAAPGHEDGIDAKPRVMPVHPPDGPCDIVRGPLALHEHVDDQQGHGPAALRRGRDDIVDRRAFGGGDDGDPAGQNGQRLLAGLVEVPQLAQLPAHRPELLLQGPCPDGLQVGDVELGPPLGRIVAHVAGGEDFIAVLGRETELLGRGRPGDATHHRRLILEREVQVVLGGEVADLADDAEGRGDALLQGGFDELGELADGEAFGFAEGLVRAGLPAGGPVRAVLLRAGDFLGVKRQPTHAAHDIVASRSTVANAGAAISLTTNIAEIAGVGRGRARAFARLGIRCVADLVRHLPTRYEHELPEQTIAAAGETVGLVHGSEVNTSVRGEVATCRVARGRQARFEATVQDGTGTILLTWFNSPWMQGRLHPGMVIRATGKTKRYGDYLQMVNPGWEAIEEDAQPAPREERYRPIYPASEDLPSAAIESVIAGVLEPTLALIDDHLHEAYRRARALPTLAEAYRMMHRPEEEEEVKHARRRLAFDELLMLQLGVMLKRYHRRRALTAPALNHNNGIDRHILARFPFELTADQRSVTDEIIADVTTSQPMNRLLQGDVGAGKTVVALYAMLLSVASKHQAALMAPTELLAEQHFASIRDMLQGSTVRIELLTGSLKAAEREAILNAMEAGEVDIIIGTHALLTETVSFHSLAVAVIDEQHRFGVHQRAMLRAKTGDPKSCPHVLVMTATPIPRTMSLTIFGDLDISTIRQLPPGRQPVITRHVPQARAGEVYEYIAKRLEGGDQAYIVVPAIEESESGLKDVQTHLEYLKAGPFRGRRLEAMHGRLKREQRDEIMGRFRARELDAIVATTVIEVGVDVPNATLMVVEHADRFGLAQLHQLRGRVGRGSKRSLCTLIADPTTPEGTARIEAIVSTNDGFEIAERDLAIRGPGELFGARQSGLPPFEVAELPRDTDLLRLARRDAVKWIEENPTLGAERDALLKKRLLKRHGEALGLGDVA